MCRLRHREEKACTKDNRFFKIGSPRDGGRFDRYNSIALFVQTRRDRRPRLS